MRKSRLLMMVLPAMFGAFSFSMADDAPVAPDEALTPEQATAPATVAIDVPAEHADLLQRAVALLQRGEQWIVDNVTAAVGTFEAMFKDDEEKADGQ